MKISDFFLPSQSNKFRAYLLKAESIVLVTIVILIANLLLPALSVQNVQAQVDLNSLVYLHNRERAKYEIPPLTLDTKLIESATIKAEVMMNSNCWDHYCPDGKSPWELFDKVGYKYQYAGENLAEGFDENTTMMTAWMNSVTHRANVLQKNFSEIGISMITGDFQNRVDNTLVVVHFARPAVQDPELNSNDFVPISQNLNQSNKIAIIYPSENLISNGSDMHIEGVNSAEITTIEILDGTNIVKRLNTIGESFILKDYDDLYEFSEGKHQLKAVGYDQNGKKVDESAVVNFIIDRTAPQIDVRNIEVDSVMQHEFNLIRFKIPITTEVYEAELIVDNVNTKTSIHDDAIYFDLANHSIDKARTISLKVIDDVGNITQYPLSKEILTEKSNEILSANKLDLNPLPLTSTLGIASSDFTFSLIQLSKSDILNLSVFAFFVLLLVVDYIILKRSGIIPTGHSGSHHYKIGLLVIAIAFTIIASGVGNILYGISI